MKDQCNASLQSCLNQTGRGTTQWRTRNPSIIAGKEKQREREIREWRSGERAEVDGYSGSHECMDLSPANYYKMLSKNQSVRAEC